jgi:hypothetical protein
MEAAMPGYCQLALFEVCRVMATRFRTAGADMTWFAAVPAPVVARHFDGLPLVGKKLLKLLGKPLAILDDLGTDALKNRVALIWIRCLRFEVLSVEVTGSHAHGHNLVFTGLRRGFPSPGFRVAVIEGEDEDALGFVFILDLVSGRISSGRSSSNWHLEP